MADDEYYEPALGWLVQHIDGDTSIDAVGALVDRFENDQPALYKELVTTGDGRLALAETFKWQIIDAQSGDMDDVDGECIVSR